MTERRLAKPAVLRCSRCGKFVDWGEARLQVVCACKSYLGLPPVFVREAQAADGPAVRELFRRDFGHTVIVAFGEAVDLEGLPVLVAEMRAELAGALAYRLLDAALHIVALATDPMWQRSGVGGYLVAEAELVARRLNRPQVLVSTTNDNLPALYFYQRRGYQISEVVPEGVLPHLRGVVARGFAGIPVRDEIRLVKPLT
jgi:ribosomal protein S18 acetylase RimI-like enzyme